MIRLSDPLPEPYDELREVAESLLAANRRQAVELKAKTFEIEALKFELARLKRWRFGASAERFHPDQLGLFEEDLETDLAAVATRQALAEVALPGKTPRHRPKRQILPAQLPRIEHRHALESCACGHCGHELTVIGEAISEQLDLIPAQFFVHRHIRPQYACRLRACWRTSWCRNTPITNRCTVRRSCTPARAGSFPAPPRPAGSAPPRYCWNRWSSVSGFTCWLRRTCRPTKPGCRCWRPAPARPGPATSGCTGRVPGARSRRWYSTTPRGVVRSGRRRSWLVSKARYRSTATPGTTPCWRGRLSSRPAAEALRRIRTLYEIEVELKDLSPEARAVQRQARSEPLLKDFRTWLDDTLLKLPPGSSLAKAIGYALGRWAALRVYLRDGRISIDSNPVERALRGVAVGRRNYLFAGSAGGGRRAALVYSLIETCKLNGVDPYAYLKDVLIRLPTQKARDLDDLLPWRWQPGP